MKTLHNIKASSRSMEWRPLSVDKCVEMLSAFGLAPRHAKVYVASILLGVAPVSKVAKTSGVRREDTYKILFKLDKLGLIEMITQKPLKIRAVPPEDGLSLLIRDWEEAADEKTHVLKTRKDEFLKHFNALVKKSKLDEEANHLALLLEKDTVVDRINMMIKNAEREIDAVTSPEELLQNLLQASKEIRRAAKRGVKIRVILGAVHDKKSFLKTVKNLVPAELSMNIRYANRPMNHYLIADFKNALIATSPEPSVGKLPYLWTDMTNFADLLQKNFEELWNACSL